MDDGQMNSSVDPAGPGRDQHRLSTDAGLDDLRGLRHQQCRGLPIAMAGARTAGTPPSFTTIYRAGPAMTPREDPLGGCLAVCRRTGGTARRYSVQLGSGPNDHVARVSQDLPFVCQVGLSRENMYSPHVLSKCSNPNETRGRARNRGSFFQQDIRSQIPVHCKFNHFG